MAKVATAMASAASVPAFPLRFRRKQLDLPKNALFSSLSRQQLRLVLPYLKQKRFKSGKSILEEGAKNPGKIYIVLDGQVAIAKEGVSPLRNGFTTYELDVVRRGEIFGEASFVDGRPSSVTFLAKSDVTVAVVNLSASKRSVRAQRLRDMVTAKLRRHIASQAEQTVELRLNTRRIEDEFEQYRSGVGHIIVTTLCLLSVYTLALSFLPNFKSLAHANFVLSPLVILLFALSFGPIIATSGFPPGFFGLRFDNWKSALSYSLQASGIFLAVLLLGKWLLINVSSAFADLPLIERSDVEISGHAVSSSSWYWLAIFVYVLLTPMQEFVARSGIQAPLYAFLHGSEQKRRWCSIMASNLVFAAAHAHISLAFAIAAFLPGILWGWIFARTNSLLAATVSNLVVGGGAIFLFGIEGLVTRMAA